jgi:hypothetical protein
VSLKNEKIQYLVATNSDMKSSYMRTKKGGRKMEQNRATQIMEQGYT